LRQSRSQNKLALQSKQSKQDTRKKQDFIRATGKNKDKEDEDNSEEDSDSGSKSVSLSASSDLSASSASSSDNDDDSNKDESELEDTLLDEDNDDGQPEQSIVRGQKELVRIVLLEPLASELAHIDTIIFTLHVLRSDNYTELVNASVQEIRDKRKALLSFRQTLAEYVPAIKKQLQHIMSDVQEDADKEQDLDQVNNVLEAVRELNAYLFKIESAKQVCQDLDSTMHKIQIKLAK
jgi:hypothetical protein